MTKGRTDAAMKRFLYLIRWKYLVPRLVVVILLLLIVYLCTDSFLKRTVISVGQRLTGSQVDVGALQSSLLSMKVKLYNVAVANPEDANRNLWEFDEAELKLNPKATFQRKLVVENGRIEGVRFDQSRDEAALPVEGVNGRWHQQLPSLFDSSWVEWFRDQLTRRINDELKTPKLARTLAQQWPQRYNKLEQKLKSIRDRFLAIRKQVEQPRPGSPLTVVQIYRTSITQLSKLNTDFHNLQIELGHLPGQLQRDWKKVGEARVHDQAHIAEMFRWQKPTPASVTEQMFGPQTKYWLSQTLYWAQTAHKWLSAGKNLLQIKRGKGVDIEFVERPRFPSLLIRHLAVSGEGALSDGSLVSFSGDLDGLTSQPDVYRRPTRFKATVKHGEQNWLTTMIVDPAKQEKNLLIEIECRDLIIPARTLGKDQWISVRLQPGRATVRLLLSITDGKLDGKLTFVQSDLNARAKVASADSAGTRELATLVNHALDQVNRLQAHLVIGGSVTKPKLKLESDFSRQAARALDVAMKAQFERFGAQMAHKVTNATSRELVKIERLLLDRRRALAQSLQLDQRQVDDMIRNLSRRISNGIISPNVSRRLPFGIR